MTDFDAATARHGFKSIAAVTLIATFGALLGGCSTAESVFGGGAPSAAIETPQPQAVAASASKASLAKISMTPLVGAPDGIAKQLTTQLTLSAERSRVTIVNDREIKADYIVRGYIVAARDKAGSKVSYIWDISDQSGKRVNRISGEEIAAGTPNAKDPWASVTPTLTQTIADKTATSLSGWLATQPTPSATPAPASTPAATPMAAAPAVVQPAVAPAETPRATPASTNTTTAALGKAGDVAVVVPAVAGAPGDGNSALTQAIQRELSRQGVALIDKPGETYRIEGKVALGATKDGKQPIQIDWRVRDPQGKSLGTVSQKNEIMPGSLDGEWGKTAEAAAAAAAQGIVKLLPQQKATN